MQAGYQRHVRACNNAVLPGERLAFRIGAGIDLQSSADAEIDWAARDIAQFADKIGIPPQTLDRETGGLSALEFTPGRKHTSRCPTRFACRSGAL